VVIASTASRGRGVQKLRSIQVLRAVAVSAVVVCHAANWLPGEAGADLLVVT